MIKGLMEVRKNQEDIIVLISIMMKESDLECFKKLQLVTFRRRFQDQLSEAEVFRFDELMSYLVPAVRHKADRG